MLLGFNNINDFILSAFGFKKINLLFATAGALSSFLTSYVYNDAGAVLFLIGMIGLDGITGVLKALKSKSFVSNKVPRILVTMVVYILLLSVSWNASIYHPLFSFLPGLVYFTLVSQQIVSVMENLSEMGLIKSGLLYSVIDRLKKGKKKD